MQGSINMVKRTVSWFVVSVNPDLELEECLGTMFRRRCYFLSMSCRVMRFLPFFRFWLDRFRFFFGSCIFKRVVLLKQFWYEANNRKYAFKEKLFDVRLGNCSTFKLGTQILQIYWIYKDAIDLTYFFFKINFKECFISWCWSHTIPIILGGITALQTSGLFKKEKKNTIT